MNFNIAMCFFSEGQPFFSFDNDDDDKKRDEWISFYFLFFINPNRIFCFYCFLFIMIIVMFVVVPLSKSSWIIIDDDDDFEKNYSSVNGVRGFSQRWLYVFLVVSDSIFINIWCYFIPANLYDWLDDIFFFDAII